MKLKDKVIISPITKFNNVIYEEAIDRDFIIERYHKDYLLDVKKYFNNINKVKIYKCLDTNYRFYYPFNLTGESDFYASLQKDPYYYLTWKWEYEIVFNKINKTDKVLEVGCGEGHFLEKLKENNINSLGLEFNQSALRECVKKGLPVSSKSLDELIKTENRRFDIVCCFQVLEHIAEVKEFIGGIINLTKLDGKIFFSVPNNDSFIKWDKRNILNMPPHHMGLWNEQALKSLPNYFKLKLVNFYYEPLPTNHVRYYYEVMIGQKLKQYGKAGSLLSLLIILPTCLLILLFAKKIKGTTVIAEYLKV